MAKPGHTEEDILRALREAESGTTVVEICRKHGISQQSFYLWKKKYAGLGLSELRSYGSCEMRMGSRNGW
jgi:putative transposase